MQALVGFVLMLAISALVIAFGSNILNSIRGTMTENSTAWNSTGQGLTGLNSLATQLPNIGLIVAAVVIIGLLIAGFGGMQGRR